MNDQFTKFITAYNAATQPIKDLIDSEKIGLFVDTLSLDMTYKPKLLVTISNRILNITKDSEMVTSLEGLGIDTTTIGKVKNFITEAIGGQSTIISSSLEVSPTNETVPAMRTMSSDSKQIGYSSVEEPTYTTMQSAIINERK